MFTVAGTEPAANLLSNMIHALATDLVRADQLRDEQGHVRSAAIDEFLRYDAPVQWVSRVTTRPVTVHSQAVPEGARILLLIGSANRDPRAHTRPDEFYPDRRPAGGLSFGVGVHACMGAALARLEARAALEVVLERSSRPRPARPGVRGRSHVLRGFETLPISFS